MKHVVAITRCCSRSRLALLMILGMVSLPWMSAADSPRVEEDGTIHVPAFVLPESAYLSAETRAALRRGREFYRELESANAGCPPLESARRDEIPSIRRCQAEAFYKTSWYKSVTTRYPVLLTTQEIGGIHTEVFTPKNGIASRNNARVLLNVHGGGFTTGGRTSSHLESMPIAFVGEIKVISIDYRMAPESTFPAASEDIAAVYREVLKSYPRENIGLYGCSAGGALTAHAVAWFQKEKLPLPGAVGLFCYGVPRNLEGERDRWGRSDAAHIVGAMSGRYARFIEPYEYYRGVDKRSPWASPGDYDAIMRKFPPALVISSSRDMLLSSALVAHAQLVRLGVEADLHVWEGMEHAFLHNPELPESREAYQVIVDFFDKHLGR